MAENITLSKDSVQLPYRRFLADSAAGFVAIGGLIFAHYQYGVLSGWRSVVPTESRVFLLVLLFLLATPLGYTVNAVSWILLGTSVAMIERLCGKYCQKPITLYAARHIAQARHANTLNQYFSTDSNTFGAAGSLFRDLMESEALSKLAPPSNARELMIFLRNLALFAITIAMLLLVRTQPSNLVSLSLVVSAVFFGVLAVNRTRTPQISRKTVACLYVTRIAVGVLRPYLIWQSTKAITVLMLFLFASLSVIVAGVVDYYHDSFVLLYSYVVCNALGVKVDASYANPDERLLGLATALITAALRPPEKTSQEVVSPHASPT